MPIIGEKNFLLHLHPSFNARNAPLPTRGEHPLHFLDSHIDDKLILKRVAVLPSLIPELLSLADDHLSTLSLPSDLLETFYHLSPSAYRIVSDISTAPEIAELQSRWIGFWSVRMAASVLLYPDQPDLTCPLMWGPATVDTFDDKSSDDFLCQAHLLTMAKFRSREPDPGSFSQENHDKLYDLGRYRE